jgi:hypothetical protein
MTVEPQKIERKDSTSFESVLIEDKSQNSSRFVSLDDIIISEEAKVFKEECQKNKIKKRNSNDILVDNYNCFLCCFWCCSTENCDCSNC